MVLKGWNEAVSGGAGRKKRQLFEIVFFCNADNYDDLLNRPVSSHLLGCGIFNGLINTTDLTCFK